MSKKFQCEPPDMQATLADLIAAGVSRRAIGDAAGVSEDSVTRYIHGDRSPNWIRGWRIMALAERVRSARPA